MNRRAFCTMAVAAAASPASSLAAGLPVRIGCLPIEADATPFYADRLGIFQKAGLDVRITPINNGAAILSAVVGGSLDLGQANIIALAAAYGRGLPVVCLGGTSIYTNSAPTSALIVSKESPIKSARDLNGKVVAVNGLRNLAQIGPMAWIDRNGGDSSTVKFIDVNFPETLTAVVTGRVDAGLVAEPVLSQARTDARILSYPFDAIAPRFLLGCFFTTTEYVKNNASTVSQFLGAIREAGGWANSHHDASAQILASISKVNPAALAHVTRPTFPTGSLVLAEVQPVIDAAAKYHIIERPFAATQFVWTS